MTSGVPFEVALLAMYGLTFFLKDSSLFSPVRNYLVRSIFFESLFSCAYCTGFHSGWIVFLLITPFPDPSSITFSFFGDCLVYAFSGMAFSGVMDAFAIRLEGNGYPL